MSAKIMLPTRIRRVQILEYLQKSKSGWAKKDVGGGERRGLVRTRALKDTRGMGARRGKLCVEIAQDPNRARPVSASPGKYRPPKMRRQGRW